MYTYIYMGKSRKYKLSHIGGGTKAKRSSHEISTVDGRDEDKEMEMLSSKFQKMSIDPAD